MRDLKGKVAAVTGAASGIGKATALLLAGEGCALAVSDINEEGLEQTRREIETLGVKVHATVLDVADKEAVHRWADDVAAEFGKVNIIVNNAGVEVGARVENMTYEDFEWLIGINFLGMVYGTKAFLPYLKQADAGHIVNVSSTAGLMALPFQAAYSSSKFGIRGFTECLRMELDLDDCSVGATSVHPGAIKTDIMNVARVSKSDLDDFAIERDKIGAMWDIIAINTPEKAARKIVSGIRKNKHRVLIGPEAYLLDIFQRLFPVIYHKALVAGLKLLRGIRLRKVKREDSG